MTSSLTLFIVILGCGLASANVSSHNKHVLLDLHNNARKAEPASNMNMLHWDNDLAYNAQAWTDKCNFAHQSGKYWGENIAVRTNHHNLTADIEKLFELWMNEKSHNSGGTFEECCSQSHHTCCHYTQVVWAKTTELGCGVTECSKVTLTGGRTMNNAVYMACYYNPPGNRPVSKCTWDWKPFIPK